MKLGSDEDDDETWLGEAFRSCEEVEGSRSLLPVIYSRYLPIFWIILTNSVDELEECMGLQRDLSFPRFPSAEREVHS